MTQLRFTKLIEKVLSHEKTRTIRKERKCSCGASIPNLIALNEKAEQEHVDVTSLEIIYKREKCICQVEKGDMLQVYVMIKLGEAPVIGLKKLNSIWDLTDEEAQLDGFEDSDKAIHKILTMHNEEDGKFRIIDFEPSWPKQALITNDEFVQKMLASAMPWPTAKRMHEKIHTLMLALKGENPDEFYTCDYCEFEV